VNPLENVLIADLDQNGFEELYLITRSVGSGSYANIYGILSVDGNRYKAIYNPENEPNGQSTMKYFQNYCGHDSIFIENQELKRIFPLYNSAEPNCCSSIGKRFLTYKLLSYENSYAIHVYNDQ
jgi:hypothetical protein